MEKKRRHKQNQAKFARKQAEIGQRKYLIVSPLTDSRMAAPTPFYPFENREHTHEEVNFSQKSYTCLLYNRQFLYFASFPFLELGQKKHDCPHQICSI